MKDLQTASGVATKIFPDNLSHAFLGSVGRNNLFKGGGGLDILCIVDPSPGGRRSVACVSIGSGRQARGAN